MRKLQEIESDLVRKPWRSWIVLVCLGGGKGSFGGFEDVRCSKWLRAFVICRRQAEGQHQWRGSSACQLGQRKEQGTSTLEIVWRLKRLAAVEMLKCWNVEMLKHHEISKQFETYPKFEFLGIQLIQLGSFRTLMNRDFLWFIEKSEFCAGHHGVGLEALDHLGQGAIFSRFERFEAIAMQCDAVNGSLKFYNIYIYYKLYIIILYIIFRILLMGAPGEEHWTHWFHTYFTLTSSYFQLAHLWHLIMTCYDMLWHTYGLRMA